MSLFHDLHVSIERTARCFPPFHRRKGTDTTWREGVPSNSFALGLIDLSWLLDLGCRLEKLPL